MEHALADHIASLKDFTDEQKVNATRVWRRLSFYIITQMKRGFAEGMRVKQENGDK